MIDGLKIKKKAISKEIFLTHNLLLCRSYWAFKEHFPENAEVLLNSLDATYKRALMSLSNSGSVNSLNSVSKGSSSNVSPRASKSSISAAGQS